MSEDLTFEEQKEKINAILLEFGLHIGDWITLNELLHSGYTYEENLQVVKDYLSEKISEHPQEFIYRLGHEGLARLEEEFIHQE